jgi:hypothetical protein
MSGNAFCIFGVRRYTCIFGCTDAPDNNAVAAAADRLSNAIKRKKKQQSPSQRHVRQVLRLLEQQESAFLEKSIDRAEQEATVMAKENKNNKQHGQREQKQQTAHGH